MKAATLFVFEKYCKPLEVKVKRLEDEALVIVAVTCRPDKPDLKQVKAEAARKKACMRDCSGFALEPVCAGKQGDKSKSFGNECVMNNYNCEHHDTLHKISKGECPGSDGIRLS